MKKAICTITAAMTAFLGTSAWAGKPLDQLRVGETARAVNARACNYVYGTGCVVILIQDIYARDGSYSYTYLSVSESGTGSPREFSCGVPIGPRVQGGGLADTTVSGEFSIDLDALSCGHFGYPSGSVVTLSFRVSDFYAKASEQSNGKETSPNYQQSFTCKTETRFGARAVTGAINGVPFPQQEVEGIFQDRTCTGVAKSF